jgi:ATP phosphoribosyltransferase
MSGPLVLAVPSKGRLEENACVFFARAGLRLERPRGMRNYCGRIAGVEGAEIAFLPAAEIAREIASGSVHLGVTGEDLIHESMVNPRTRVEVLTKLGFGETTVVVAVPQSWIDVSTMDDLDDVAHAFRLRHGRRMRVATKYINLTQAYFSSFGIADYRVVESLGATEGAPIAGTAEIIVDITTTGSTLAANGLKVLDDGAILKSEACLVASLVADWNEGARDTLAHVLGLVAAEARARDVFLVGTNMGSRRANFFDELIDDAGGIELSDQRNGALELLVRQDRLYEVTRALRTMGAGRVTVSRQDYIFESRNSLYEQLIKRLEEAC